MQSPTEVTQPVDRQPMPPLRHKLVSPLVGRIPKTMLSLGAVAAVGFVPLQGLLQTSGVEAVINARVTTLRAPIDGEVQPGPNPLAFRYTSSAGRYLVPHRRSPRGSLAR